MVREIKDSGIAWIGEIPKDWEVGPIGMFFNEINNPNSNQEETNTLQFKMGDIISKKNGDSKYNPETIAAYNVVEPGTIMINGLNLSFDLISQRVAQVHERGAITSTYLAMMPKNGLQSDYAKYMLKAYDNCKALHSMGRGLRATLSYSTFRTEPIFKPSIEEQRLIANFLDEKCGEIDELVALQEKMIEELKAYKQSVITETVTKGLDKNVKMKDSGVDWIGEIPEHWESKRLKFVSNISRGLFNHRPRNDERYYGGEYPFIQTGDVARAVKYITTFSQTLSDLGVSVSKCFPKGTLTMTIAANVGDVSILDFDAYFPDSVLGIVPHTDMNNMFLYYMLKAMKTELVNNAIISTQLNLNVERVYNMFSTVPPLEEQKLIATYLDEKCSEIDSLISIKQKKIEELKDYKKSLIYEHVTGKKQVI